MRLEHCLKIMFRDKRETNCCDEIFETFLALFWIRFDPPEKALEDAFFASHDDVVHLKVLLHLIMIMIMVMIQMMMMSSISRYFFT